MTHWSIVTDVTVRLWAALGPLVGVLIGAYITNRNQRKHWVADSKKQEFRELLGILTRSYDEILEKHTPMVAYTPEDQRRHAEAEKSALAVIRDRILIARELEGIKLEQRWMLAMLKLDSQHDSLGFSAEFSRLRAEILKAAERALT